MSNNHSNLEAAKGPMVPEQSPFLVMQSSQSSAITDVLQALHQKEQAAAVAEEQSLAEEEVVDFQEPLEPGATRSPTDWMDHPLRATETETNLAFLGSASSHHSSSTASAVHRQRRGSQQQQRSWHRTGAPSVSSTTTSGSSSRHVTSSSSLSSRTTSSRRSRPTAAAANNTLSLRGHLDAGMAAVRRWIRSHSAVPAPPPTPPMSSRARGRTHSWQPRASDYSSASNSSSGEEDFLGLSLPEDSSVRLAFAPHPTIFEEDDWPAAAAESEAHRQRAQSEPDIVHQLRHAVFYPRGRLQRSARTVRRRQRPIPTARGRAHSESHESDLLGLGGPRPQLSESAAAALYTTGLASNAGEGPSAELVPVTTTRDASMTDAGLESLAPSVGDGTGLHGSSVLTGTNGMLLPVADAAEESAPAGGDGESPLDPEREARARWIRINRRFHLVITIVALIFSLLLFSILICWVVLTSTYVVSFDLPCDVPLKAYFWVVTLQLILDVFRTDILRFVFCWDSQSREGIPCRVIIYNVCYLIYAMLVLRLGIVSVYMNREAECRTTAPELYNASTAFVTLSLAAWATIIFGYVVPLCVVAAMLTYNGYNPSAAANQDERATQAVFPAAYSSSGAPPGTVDLLPTISIHDFPDDFPRECCICMEEFDEDDSVVKTACNHVFHKSCCKEWLRQARSCPVCRNDIPSTIEDLPDSTPDSGPHIPVGPTGRPVVGLLRMLRSSEPNEDGRSPRAADHTGEVDLEQGRPELMPPSR